MLDAPKPKGAKGPINWRRGCLSVLLAYVGLPIVFFTSFKIAFEILEVPIISSEYAPGGFTPAIAASYWCRRALYG